jgi:aminopeptidase-like protein
VIPFVSSDDPNVRALDEVFDELFPIARSITGPGLWQSLEIFRREMPLTIEAVPSGERVFDWTVPHDWTIRAARLIGPNGTTYCDFARCNLEVVNYSEPINRRLSLGELQSHLHSIPKLPDAIPYVTSYYRPTWGFCMPHSVRVSLPPGEYHALIDSDFDDSRGVPFGHTTLPGETTNEVMITSYLCHPSLANNELSGPLTLLGLYRRLARWPRRRLSYRFVLHPETIGSLCYLSRYGDHLRKHVIAGLVLTCTGGPSPKLSYKASRSGDTLLDDLVTSLQGRFDIRDFDPTGGSDERQYCSPGFNLPMGQIGRTLYGQYDAYHTSLDDKTFMTLAAVESTIDELERLFGQLELAGVYRNRSPFGEPQLGRRDLYPNVNSHQTREDSSDVTTDRRAFLNRILWALNGSDGRTRMLDIAKRAGCGIDAFEDTVLCLEREGLLELTTDEQRTPLFRSR